VYGGDERVLVRPADRDGVLHQNAEQRRVSGKNAQLAVHGAGKDDLSLARPHHPVGGNELNLHGGHGQILPASGQLTAGGPIFRFLSIRCS